MPLINAILYLENKVEILTEFETVHTYPCKIHKSMQTSLCLHYRKYFSFCGNFKINSVNFQCSSDMNQGRLFLKCLFGVRVSTCFRSQSTALNTQSDQNTR